MQSSRLPGVIPLRPSPASLPFCEGCDRRHSLQPLCGSSCEFQGEKRDESKGSGLDFLYEILRELRPQHAAPPGEL
jgi:hypothetical protein